MPNDDTKDFQAAQRSHAEQIRTERVIGQITGLQRSQIRAGLRSFQQQTQQTTSQAAPAQATSTLPTQPLPAAQPITLPIQRFAAGEGGGGRGGVGSVAGEIPEVILVINGTGFEDCILNGIIGTEIP